MSNGITEITNETVKPVVPPMEVGGKDLSSESKVTEISAEPIAQPTPIKELKETTTMVGNNNETMELEKIPGVKEVRVIPSEANKRPAAFMGPDGKPLDFNMQQFIKETMNGGMINRLVKRYDLEGVDLEKEAALIEQKKSSLSASKRKAVIALLNMRNQQKQLLTDIGKELMHKDNPSDEDLRRLLDSVEDASTNTEEVEHAVVENIVRKSVEQVLEESRVDYTPESKPEKESNKEADGSIPLTIGE